MELVIPPHQVVAAGVYATWDTEPGHRLMVLCDPTDVIHLVALQMRELRPRGGKACWGCTGSRNQTLTPSGGNISWMGPWAKPGLLWQLGGKTIRHQ